MLILNLFNTLPWPTATDIITGIFIASFGIGCFIMCYAVRKSEEKHAKRMVCGVFGFLGLICTEAITSWLITSLFETTIPQVTMWYGYPCAALLILGFFGLVYEAIVEAWQRA